jgi:hypothetical protein
MKINWKPMVASLAVLMGISGVAFGQDRDDHRGRDNRARVVDHDRDHDRDNRGWNNHHRSVDARDYRHHDRYRAYNGRVYNPYYHRYER